MVDIPDRIVRHSGQECHTGQHGKVIERSHWPKQTIVDTTRLGLDRLSRASLDRTCMLHVGMNVADKAALFTKARQVLVDRGSFGV